MDYLPIILKTGRPPLEALRGSGSRERAICPRGRIFAHLDEQGHLRLSLLFERRHQQLQQVDIDSDQFTGFQWVTPSQTDQDCVLDEKQEEKSELFAVSSNFDLYWYGVYEVAEGGEESGGEEGDGGDVCLCVERLALLRRSDLCSELRKMECSDVIDVIRPLGSSGDLVLLLLSPTLVCGVGLDCEFGRVVVHNYLMIDTSVKPYQDPGLPQRVRQVVSHAFRSPLLFTLCEDGHVFIHNMDTAQCIGIVSTVEYCKYASGRQPESEELLSQVRSARIYHVAISPDLTHLVATTQDNHLLLVNLPDYFQVFPNHYHPVFLSRFVKKRNRSPKSRSKQTNTSRENEEDRRRYGGMSERHIGERFLGPYPGYYAWTNRINQLNQSVDRFQPSKGQYLSLYRTSELPDSQTSKETRAMPKMQESFSGAGTDLQPVEKSERAWYEGPFSHVHHQGLGSTPDVDSLRDFHLQFVTGIKKQTTPAIVSGLQANGTEALAPSRFFYQSSCILPSASSLMLMDTPVKVVHVSFTSGVVVGYYGIGRTQGETEGGVAPPSSQVVGMVVYRTESLSYSIARLAQPSWLILSSNPNQPVYLATGQHLTVATYSLSQEEFVSRLLMYGNAQVVEEVCHLNHWDKCSLPISALETALELRQLDTLSFFLKRKETESTEDSSSQQQQDASELPSLPPLPPDQLDTIIQLLIAAIRRNYQEKDYFQFASQLLIMTLTFLTRTIKNQALREQSPDSQHSTLALETDEPGRDMNTTRKSPRKRTVSGTSAETTSLGGASTHEAAVSLHDLTSYIQELRSYLPGASLIQKGGGGDREGGRGGRGRDRSMSPVMEDHITGFMDRIITDNWDKMNPKEVIKDALMRGCLPLAQAYLFQRKPEDSSRPGKGGFGTDSAALNVSLAEAVEDRTGSPEHHAAPPNYDASFGNILITATGFVMETLEKGRIKLAVSLLTQMGLDAKTTLRHICFHTLNRQLRDFLVKELIAREWLSDPEVKAWEYLLILESYYPLQSYEEAHALHCKHHPRKIVFQSTALPVMPGIANCPTHIPPMGNLHELFPETFGGDYALCWDTSFSSSPPPLGSHSGSPPPLGSHSGSLYIQVPLCAVLTWDSATRQRLLFEGFLLTGQAEGVDCERLVSKEHIFKYYISHSDLVNATQFVMSRVPPLENHTPCPTQLISMCSRMSHVTQYLSDTLLDELARHGVLLPYELSNLPYLLHRLGRVHTLFTHPHPLTKTTSHVTEGDGGALVSLEGFHRGFLKYLIENRFVSLMYHYLDCYSLALDDSSISSLGLDTTDEPWVDVMLQYRKAALNSLDPNAVFQASLSCSRLLLDTSGSDATMNVMAMLQAGKTFMALASLMFAPHSLEEAMETSSGQWYVDPSILRPAIAAYPTLQAAIFPAPPTTLTPAQSQDITVYQLLQGSVPFNISHLFKWQTTNVLATQDDSTEGTSDIPHFSSVPLADQFALTEHLTYFYFLQRGQPSFAFANFVAAKLIGHSNTTKRIDRAVSHVYRLAMQDFTNPRLVSSCAAFIEMVDRDSTLLRVDLQAALRIARHGQQQQQQATEKSGEGSSKHQKIPSHFIQLHQSPDSASLSSSLLSQLESATHNMVASATIDRCGLEAEDCWVLVQMFCHCHHLPSSVAFLTTCAQEGQWLPLLCHAQLYSIPPQNVLITIEKHFANPCIQEHLRLAISSMDAGDQLTSPVSPQVSGGFAEKPKSRRKRANSVKTRTKRAESLVQTQPDLRAKFYSKVGLQKEAIPSLPQHEPKLSAQQPTEEPAHKHTGEGQRGTPEQDLPPALDEMDLPSDLFSVLFKCQSHESPWRSLLAHAIALQRPLLAILAACYEHGSMVDCVCVWLYSTLGCEVLEKAATLLGIKGEGEEKLKFSADLQWRQWTPQDLSILLVTAMQHSPSPATQFTLALLYFDQNNPLLSFLRFHEEFVLRSNFDECRKHLQEFELSMDKCSMYNYMGTIGDTCWVELLASTMASHMLVMCPTPFERSHLLKLLSEASFGESFQCTVLKFKELHKMSDILRTAGLTSDTAFTITEHFLNSPGAKSLSDVYSVRVRINSDHVLSVLLERGQFDVARKYADIVGSTASEVTIKEVEHNLGKISKSSYWQYEQARLNFWQQCNTLFEGEHADPPEPVDPESAAEFFESIVRGSSEDPLDTLSHGVHGGEKSGCSATEKALLLAYALKWRKRTNMLSAEQLRELEKEIWLSHIHAIVEETDESTTRTGSSPLPFFPKQRPESVLPSCTEDSSLLSSLSISALSEYKDRRKLGELLLPDGVSIVTEGKSRRSLSEKESEALDMMLGRLLNAGLVTQARELAALFEHDSPDLTIVLCCIQLAQGKLTPDQLTEGVLMLVSTRQPRHLSDPTLSLDDTGDGRPSAEIIRMMHKLSDRATYAQQCCSCIITCFKIAITLKVPYSAVITSEPFDVLTQLLGNRQVQDRYSLSWKFIDTCNLEPKEVAGYLSECIKASLHSYHGDMYKCDYYGSPKACIYNPQMSSSQFMELVQLCSDHTVLGNHLLTMAKSISTTEQHLSATNMAIQVELLVRAHDCYTLGCCVDGIAEVLLVTRKWASTLIKGRHFKLMVRLLTGIGRFHEMSYIIGLLLECDEFESLVHAGVEKEEQLRVALMNYLLKQQPPDHEKTQMVALKFGMFRELAQAREDQAKRDLHKIRPKALAANNPDTVKTLKNVFDAFRTAAKTYSQEDCLANAEHCYSQARLVALQLSVLQSGKQVINLDVKKVHRYMEEQPFNEALIVADAYKQCIWTDWVNPLYRKVVVGGDFRYLHDFKSAFPLTPTLFQQLASKFLHDRERPPDATANMRKLLTVHLKNLPLRRRLAAELGMTDVLQTLSSSFNEGFLNDVARL